MPNNTTTMSRERRHIRSLRRIAQLTGLPYTFRIPMPFPIMYERDFIIFFRYMDAYPGIWEDVHRVAYIPPLP